MTLDYNDSRVKTKTRVGDKDEISSYNKIVGSADYCIKVKLKNNGSNSNRNKILIEYMEIMIVIKIILII